MQTGPSGFQQVLEHCDHKLADGFLMSPNRISAGVTVDPQESAKHISFLSGSDAVRILELIQSSLSCSSESDFAALFPND